MEIAYFFNANYTLKKGQLLSHFSHLRYTKN